jgi:hypothetical protein
MAKKRIKLIDICYYRSGDKGDISNIGLMAKDEKAYEIIKRGVTPELIKAHFKGWETLSSTRWTIFNRWRSCCIGHWGVELPRPCASTRPARPWAMPWSRWR